MGKKIVWTDRAGVQLRAIDQSTALRMLHALARLLATGEGDVKRLQDIDPLSSGSESESPVSAFTILEIASKSSP